MNTMVLQTWKCPLCGAGDREFGAGPYKFRPSFPKRRRGRGISFASQRRARKPWKCTRCHGKFDVPVLGTPLHIAQTEMRDESTFLTLVVG